MWQMLEYLAFFMLAGATLTALHLRRRYRTVQVHNLPDFLVFCASVPKLTGAGVLLDLHDLMPEFMAASEVAAWTIDSSDSWPGRSGSPAASPIA